VTLRTLVAFFEIVIPDPRSSFLVAAYSKLIILVDILRPPGASIVGTRKARKTTRVDIHAKTPLFAEGRMLTKEELKYA
jgi:hypothetical protein